MAAYYCQRGGQRLGPFDGGTLRRMAAGGEIGPADLIWAEGRPDWTPASRVKGLFPVGDVGAAAPRAAVAAAPPADRYSCDRCGGEFGIDHVYADGGGTICKPCYARRAALAAAAAGGVPAAAAPAGGGPARATLVPAYASAAPAGGGYPTGLVIGGYACAVASLIFCPIGFGAAAVSLGTRCLSRGAKGNGTAIIILGITLGIISWVIGMAFALNRK